MSKKRLDHLLVEKKLVPTRSQAESYIRLGEVKVDGRIITKPGFFVNPEAKIEFGPKQQYVSRAALKLASVSAALDLNFKNTTVLDVGSSSGGFTDYALQHGAAKVIAVDVGTNQLHEKLRLDSRVELHEKTNILDYKNQTAVAFNLIVIDVSFTSLRNILPHIRENLANLNTQIIAMVKPQFEAGREQLNKGIIKNSAQRRNILQQFELWCRSHGFVIVKKSDSAVAGEKGNLERFYLLKKSA